MSIKTLTIDDLCFELRWSDRRKTVGITVDRGGELILTAPFGCPIEEIERIARRKQFWVYMKLALKGQLLRAVPKKEFVTGEGFPYLGRHYRLLLANDDPASKCAPLRLHGGRFILRKTTSEKAHEDFVNWYTLHARAWLRRRVSLFADRIDVTPSAVEVRDLGYRWGSCTSDGKLNFHWRSILLPPRIVEYIVAHELVHLHEPHHGEAFWRRLERCMPDFEARKQWLAETAWSSWYY